LPEKALYDPAKRVSTRESAKSGYARDGWGSLRKAVEAEGPRIVEDVIKGTGSSIVEV
jgi:hypothetical protein